MTEAEFCRDKAVLKKIGGKNVTALVLFISYYNHIIGHYNHIIGAISFEVSFRCCIAISNLWVLNMITQFFTT